MKLPSSRSVHSSSHNDAGEFLISSANTSPLPSPKLFPRKGGGGHGGGHGSSGKGGGSSSSSKGSPAASHGASSAFTGSRSAGGFSVSKSGKTTTTATAYSNGGGKQFTLGSDTPFSGRQAGGGDRSTVYGTSRFGSGYPYGGYGYYVDYRPFPYEFYPVSPAYHYYGADEYLNINETQRPGGNLVSAIIHPSWNTSVTYRLLGDNNSVTAVFDALVANCSVANSSSAITAYTPSPMTWPLPEQIIQYYRASTFALSLDGYNNTASLTANMPANNDTAPWPLSQDSPLPAGLNSTFLVCVNTTIGASVPLIDVESHKLSAGQIIEIVGLSIQGIIVLSCILCWINSCCRKRRAKKETKATSSNSSIDHITEDLSLKEMEAALDRRNNTARGGWWPRTPFARSLGYRAIQPDSTNLPEAVKHEEHGSERETSTQSTKDDTMTSMDDSRPPEYNETSSVSMPGAFGSSPKNIGGPQFPKPYSLD